MKYFIIPFATNFKLLSDGTVWNISENAQVPEVKGKCVILPTEDFGKKVKKDVPFDMPVEALMEIANKDEGAAWIASVEKDDAKEAEKAAKKAINIRKNELNAIIAHSTDTMLEHDGGTPEFNDALAAMKAAKAELATIVTVKATRQPKAEKPEKEIRVKGDLELASEANIALLKEAIEKAKADMTAAIEVHNATEGWYKFGGRVPSGERSEAVSADFELVQNIRKFASEHPDLKASVLAKALVENGITEVELSASRLGRYLTYRQHLIGKEDTQYLPFDSEYFNCYKEEKIAEIPGIAERAAGMKGNTLQEKIMNAWYQKKTA